VTTLIFCPSCIHLEHVQCTGFPAYPCHTSLRSVGQGLGQRSRSRGLTKLRPEMCHILEGRNFEVRWKAAYRVRHHSFNHSCIFTARRVCIARTMLWQDVCPSVCQTPVLSLNNYTYPQSSFHHRVAPPF